MSKHMKIRQSRGILPLVIVVVGVLIFGSAIAAAWYYRGKYNQLSNMSAEQFSQRDNDKVIKAVGKLYSLPSDETPSIATIKDKDTVKTQYPFLSEAENGDTLLLYKNKQLAILYRSSTKQLVKVGALNIQDGPTVKVIGLESYRTPVEQKLTGSKVTFTSDTPKTSLIGITVVDPSGKMAEQAKTLAETLGGQVGQAPSGETVPADVDLVVYVGSSSASTTGTGDGSASQNTDQ